MCVALFSCCKPKQDNSASGGAGTEPEIPVEQPWHDMTDKFERISDDELLTLVQKHAFGYFYDYAHPVSGLARERLGSGDTVTSGGSGFGIGAIPVAVERGFISREEGYSHLRKIVDFLSAESTERFHGPTGSTALLGRPSRLVPKITERISLRRPSLCRDC